MSITVRKLKLIIVNDNEDIKKEQYKFIRDAQYAQYQALNLGMGYLMTGYLASNRDIKSEDFTEWKKGLKNSNPIFKGIHNTIANLITVSNEYSLALMTSLTSSSNYLVVDSKAVASRLVTYLKENKLGRATFYPLDTMKPRNVYEEDLIKIKDNPSFIGILNNLVEYDPIYTNVISNLIFWL